MKRFYFPSRLVALLFLNILLCVNIATGQVSFSPTSLKFGSVQTGSSTSQTLIMSNTGKSNLTVSQITLAGQGFSLRTPTLPLTLSSGQNAVISVVFAPVSGGSASGNISVAISTTSTRNRTGKHNGSSTTATGGSFLISAGSVPLSGTGTSVSPTPASGMLVANPAVLGFTTVQTGNSQTKWETLTNSGGSTLTISSATISSATTGNSFTLSGLNLPTSLTAGQSVTFGVTFAPAVAGGASGSIVVNSDVSTSALAISLAGTGTAPGQLALTPSSADFGSVIVGNSKVQSGTLVASGSSVTISSASVSDAEFSLTGVAFPVTMAPGQSMPFTLTFVPRASGTAAATLSFASNAVNSTTASLTGAGVPAPQHNVNLSWDTDPGVVGYNIYRGNQPGGPYSKINPVLNSSISYTDSSVQGGQNYYYVTNAVDSTGAQSTFSNETHAGIPTP